MESTRDFRKSARFFRRAVEFFCLLGVNLRCNLQPASGRLCSRLLIASFVALGLCSPAMSDMRQNDSWIGMDKANHFGVSAPLGMFGATMADKSSVSSEQFFYGTLVGSLPGLLKEIVDIWHPGSDASLKDLAWDIVGAATGALSTRWFSVTPMTYRDHVDGFRIQIRIDF